MMKVIVADKISERGVKLLKEQAGWNVVLTTKETIGKEIGGRGRADHSKRDESYGGIAGEGAAAAGDRARRSRRRQH